MDRILDVYQNWSQNRSEEVIGNQLGVLLSYAFEYGLVDTVRVLKQRFEDRTRGFRPKTSQVIDLDPKDLVFVIAEFEYDICELSRDTGTLFHRLVETRNTASILSVLEFLTEISKSAKFCRNSFLKNLQAEDVFRLLSVTNSDGLTAYEVSVIKKHMDIKNIIEKFFGEKAIYSVRLAKYKLDIIDENPKYTHRYKDMLLKFLETLENTEKYSSGIDNPLLVECVTSKEVAFLDEVLNNLETLSTNEKAFFFPEYIQKRDISLVETLEALEKMLSDLSSVTIIGVDLEYHLETKLVRTGFSCLI